MFTTADAYFRECFIDVSYYFFLWRVGKGFVKGRDDLVPFFLPCC